MATLTETFTNIADAIRTKNGSSDMYTPAEMPDAIEAIAPKLQSKSATPSETAQTISPDSSYEGLSSVNIGAISSTYVGSEIARKSSTDLIASGDTITVPAGYYASNAYKSVATTTHPKPTISVNTNTGLITASHAQTSGYITDAIAGTTTATRQLTTDAGGTYNPEDLDGGDSPYVLGALIVNAGTMLTGLLTVNDTGDYVGSRVARKSSSDLTASGATVTVPAGYYSAQATKSVATMNLPTSASSSATSGYTSKATISRSTSDQYINIAPGYNSAGGYYKINAVANGSVTVPSSISGSSATVSTGTNTLTLTKSVSVTPSVTTAGYISAGTAGNSSVSLTASVTTKAAATITPGTTNQTIASGTYLTGTQTISGDADLTAANIKQGTQIFGVTGSYTSDATAAASDIVSGQTAYVNGSKVTGDLIINKYYTGSTAPSSSLGNNGDIYFQS